MAGARPTPQGDRPARIVYLFAPGRADAGTAALPEILGRKGANLLEMCRLGMPVPPGFTVSTGACRDYRRSGKLSPAIAEEIHRGIAFVEEVTGLKLGDHRRPLLFSARSGAAVSMPGMMDTVLNLGLNQTTVGGLMRFSGNPRFAWDSYRRLIAMFGEVVVGIPPERFQKALREVMEAAGAETEYELDAEALQGLSRTYREVFASETGRPFPDDPYGQILEATEAVFRSFDNPRATEYRRLHKLQGLEGTAVTLQAMVFGNFGCGSGAGVAFTRNPLSGENSMYVDFLFNAQGEDIVSGTRTPDTGEEFLRSLPDAYQELADVRDRLEGHFRDMQDIEFTVQLGKLYLLQTRTGKRSPRAALRIGIEMADEGLIDRAEALRRIEGIEPGRLRRQEVALPGGVGPIALGTPASPGVASGRIAMSPRRAIELRDSGEPAILVREETSPDDLGGMAASVGIVTAHGGRTSHASVVARQMGIACVVGCPDLNIQEGAAKIQFGERSLGEGDPLTIDGEAGAIYAGTFEVVDAGPLPEVEKAARWARELGLKDHPILKAGVQAKR